MPSPLSGVMNPAASPTRTTRSPTSGSDGSYVLSAQPKGLAPALGRDGDPTVVDLVADDARALDHGRAGAPRGVEHPGVERLTRDAAPVAGEAVDLGERAADELGAVEVHGGPADDV